MKKSDFALFDGMGMAENSLSHVLLLCVTDLNASHTQGAQTTVPNQGSIQSPPESLKDAESGARVEEKIVYL